MKKPTPSERELLKMLADGSLLERTSTVTFHVGAREIDRATFDALCLAEWIEFDGVLGLFTTAYGISVAGRKAIE